ncbi:Glutamate/aspartate periplasmic-binding protein precursor [Gimesia maris]|uniref:substrate-binding periplasmic protein n=1 Tax=Gimesia maris TaxID=122 RepID=UPI00118A2AA0|nr:transporter substrate-binding domain-containing protein [Gimesia maris]QDT78246.1 Glutamate/aspartate periplasmic-binding protein precursor [Gimesia maris]
MQKYSIQHNNWSRRHFLKCLPLSAFAIVGCNQQTHKFSNKIDTLEKVTQSGVLRAGYFVEPPAVMKDPNSGELRGSYVGAIKTIAAELGVKVDFIEVDLARFAAGIQNDLYDVSIGSTFRTIKRSRVVAFTDTIYYLGFAGVTPKGRGDEFRTEADVNRKGVRVALKEGAALQTYAKERWHNPELVILTGTDLSLPLQAVSSGQADVGFINEHTTEFYARNHDDVEIIFKDNPILVLGMSWAVRPDDTRWLQFLNTSLEALVSTGQMARWERKFYGEKLRRQIIEPDAPNVQT